MKITQPQRITIMKLWQRVCKDRDWQSGDRQMRLDKFGELLGRKLESTDDIERIAECTKLMNGLKTMLGISIQAGIEAADTTINDARVLRFQIVTEIVPCLELYVHDSVAYITSIMEDKNRWWKIDRPARAITLDDLDAKPTWRKGKDGKPSIGPSQLQQLQWTLSARLNELRNAAGDTIHDMRIKAKLPCACARCVSTTNSVPKMDIPEMATRPVKEPDPY